MKKILIADDEKNMRWALRKALEKENWQVEEAADGLEALEVMERTSPHVILLDLKMPRLDGLEALKKIKALQSELPVVMMTAHGTMESAVEAMKIGAADYLSKPFELEELKIVVEKAVGESALRQEVLYLREELENKIGKALIGESQSFQNLREQVGQVAKTNATVLILGESGTGKELIANAIHKNSLRSANKLVKINCGAIPRELMESELFGYEKGAFTGALGRKIGKFEVAHEGTLFLDEVGELDLSMQVKLLRALQEKEIERIGSNRPISVDVRIIAATNRNLVEMVQAGTFREDLFYRLNVIPLTVPPLRERKEDIPLFVQHFLKRFTREFNRGPLRIEADALERMSAYPWRGNVRELENVMERMVILAKGDTLDAAQLPREILSQEVKPELILPEEGISLEKLEISLMKQALERTNFNQTHAARLLGLSRHTLLYRMDKYGLHNGEAPK